MRKMKDSGIEWIGEIPEDWEVGRVKNIAELISGYAFDSEDLNIEGKNIVIRIGDIKDGSVDIENANKTNFNDEVLSFFQVKNNDVLIAMSGATVGKLGYVNFTPKNTYINQRVGILRSSFSKFLYYALSTNKFIEYILLESIGSAQPNISNDGIKNYPLCIPSLPEQQRIADFLDRKCSEIDAVIAKTKATIEEYKNLKQSVITEADTKGIRGDRPMKDSGNIWYGSVPTEWDIRKMKYVFTIKKDIAGKEGYTVLSITLKGVVPKNISSNEGQLAENYSNYQLVAIGDFAMNHMDLLTGWVDISKHEGVTSPDYRVFILNDTINNCKQYYLYLMQMCYSNRIFYGLGQGVSGMGRWRLQADKFLNFTIPIPPTQEQKEIADFLDRKCSEIDKLITKKEQLVVELESYKKSLIYEVVTGKRSV